MKGGLVRSPIRALAALVAVGVLCLQAVPAVASEQNEGVSRIVYAGALVVGQGVCGGTYITPNEVLTAAHCIFGLTPKDEITVTDVRGLELHAKVIKENDGYDLALLRTESPDPNVVPSSLGIADGVKWGQEVWAFGSPGGEPFVLAHGYVSKIQTFDMKDLCDPKDPIGTASIQRLYLDMRVFFGNSGGGLFDTQGRLIGVVNALASEEFGKKHSKDDPLGCKSESIGFYVVFGYAIGPEAVAAFLTQ